MDDKLNTDSTQPTSQHQDRDRDRDIERESEENAGLRKLAGEYFAGGLEKIPAENVDKLLNEYTRTVEPLQGDVFHLLQNMCMTSDLINRFRSHSDSVLCSATRVGDR